MPMPAIYADATRDWRMFLADAREETGLPSDHATYTAVEGVLRTFRRRLTVEQALAFADVLPAVLRAVFVADWRPEPPLPFAPRTELADEVKALRRHHNFAPDDAIPAVARALRAHVDARALERVLSGMPDGARAFWQGTP